MSDSTTKSSPSFTRPIAMPATGALIGTPASISDSELPQTEAIEEEPFDSVISETTRMVYGNSSIVGTTASTPRLARRPWPISRRFGHIMLPASPTESVGKLRSEEWRVGKEFVHLFSSCWCPYNQKKTPNNS